MKRPVGPDPASSPGGVPIPPSKLITKLHLLDEVMTSPVWDGDEARGQRRLSLHVEGALVRCTLQVEVPALRLSAIGRSLDDALASMEALLGSPDVPWEQDRYPLGVRTHGRKK